MPTDYNRTTEFTPREDLSITVRTSIIPAGIRAYAVLRDADGDLLTETGETLHIGYCVAEVVALTCQAIIDIRPEAFPGYDVGDNMPDDLQCECDD